MEHIPETQVMSEGMEQNNNNSRNVSRKRLVRKRSFLDALTEKYCVNMNDDNYEFVHIVITGKPRNNGTDAELAHLRNVVSRIFIYECIKTSSVHRKVINAMSWHI